MDPSLQPQQPYFVSAPIKGFNDYDAERKRRWPWVVLILLVVAVVGFVGWKFWSGRDSGEQAVSEVQITAQGFTPVTITITKGQAIMWTNKDPMVHQIYAEQNQAPDLDSQEPLAEGDAYIFTFDKAGTYAYYDPLNPTQYKATVIVK